jgi:type IV secretory pathway TrbD component
MLDDPPVLTEMHASLNRPQLLMGGDRELVLLAGLLSAVMAVSVMTMMSFFIAGVAFGTIVMVLARLGKADPLMRKVYGRHIRYKDFYPAKSGKKAVGIPTRMSWL